MRYLSTAVLNVEFSETAQLKSLTNKSTTLEKLNLSILTAAQL